MKKALKRTGVAVGILFLLIALLLTYVKTMLPNVGEAPKITVEKTPEQIERGKYLANHVMVCMDCHSTRDYSLFSGPMVAGTDGKGGEVFDQKLSFPGKFVAPNLTPFHLADWTDGEIFRAITTGVSKDGRALFPTMPYHNYGQLDKEDIEAVIAYLRTLPSIENKTEASVADFPMNFIINTIPKAPDFQTRPAASEAVNYGKYVLTAAGCKECHTKQEKGKFVGEPFAGGFEFPLADGSKTVSANITSDKETGIGYWTKEAFISRFKMYADSSYVSPKVAAGEFQTYMPWTMYAHMTEEDLGAIYDYLQTTTPVVQSITKFKPAK